MTSARDGTAADHEAAVQVWRAARAATGMRPTKARVERVQDKLTAPGALLSVVDGVPVLGMALGEIGLAGDGAGPPQPGLLHLSMLCVHPDHRRRGYATALLEQLTDRAWLRGYRRMSVWTRVDNDAATACYLAAGLELSGRSQQLPDGTTAQQLVAELAPPVREVVVRLTSASGEPLRLGQALKLAGLADTGSQARQLVVDGLVTVNDEPELRRGRQLADGDLLLVGDDCVRVVAAG